MNVFQEAAGGPISLTVDDATKVCAEAGVEWSKRLCVWGFRISSQKFREIEENVPLKEDKLRTAIEYLLNADPTPSYRRIITAVDYWDSQHSAASRMYKYAEPVTDSTLTPEKVAAVLERVKNAASLYNMLMVPKNRRTSGPSEVANHWVSYGDKASWEVLCGKLYYLVEKEALELAKGFLPILPPDPSLTVENMCSVLKGMEWDHVSKWLGVSYSERGKIKLQFDDNSDNCSKAAWNLWLKTFPAPSWEFVAEALFDWGQHDAIKHLERQYPAVISPARRQIACERAIKEKGSLEDTIVQGNCCGFPRAGKSSFKDRLVGRFRTTNASTGVAEKVVRIEVSTSVVLAGEHMWEQLDDLGEETSTAAEKITRSISQSLPSLSLMETKGTRHAGERREEKTTDDEEEPTSITPYTALNYSRQYSDSISCSTSPDGVTTSITTRRKMSPQKRWTLYMSDVGGQPEFQELFPNLLFGSSLFFYTFRADQELNVSFRVEYLHSSGESMVPYEASVSTGESILQFLASVASIGTVSKPGGGATVCPKVFFIATHTDKLESEQKVLELDKELKQIVKQTQAYKDGMIVCNSKSCMLFPVNNLSEDEADFIRVREAVNNIVTSSDDYRYTIPYTWSIFSFTIQHCPDQVIPYATCFDIAKKCGIDTEEELDNCLWFLHHQIGILRHFRDIPELRDKVFKDTQYMFDRITELIVHTFTFDKLHGNIFLHDEFVKKGIFSLSSLKKLYSASKYLSPSQLVKLLQHLQILAILKSDGEETKYFVPCSLVHADPNATARDTVNQLPPLCFSFSNGYCPKGLFGALVANLLQSSQQDYEWKFKEDQIFRDQISFCVGPYLDRFQFTVTSSYISIEVFPSEAQDRRVPLASVCCHVRQHISTNIVEVTKKLNYDPKRTPHRLAFQCPNKTCHAATHSAIINFIRNEPCALECPYSLKTANLPENDQIWFNENFSPEQKAAATTVVPVKGDSGALNHSKVPNSVISHIGRDTGPIPHTICPSPLRPSSITSDGDTPDPDPTPVNGGSPWDFPTPAAVSPRNSPPKPPSRSAPPGDGTLEVDDLGEVYSIVEVVAAKWRLLSTKLHVKESRLDIIEKNNPNDVESCLLDALRQWLRLNYDHEKHGKPSWKKLAKAVKNMDGRLFEKIVNEHSIVL